MDSKKKVDEPVFTSQEARAELRRVLHRKRYWKYFRSTVGTLLVAAACAVLAATLWLPVLRVYGNSMTPHLAEGDLVASVKSDHFETGDVIAFYSNNKILIKRVIAGPGEWVYIDENGTVSVNNEILDEPYVDELALGETNIEMPYQVPEERWFVMGDHRSVSLDSRNKAIGPVAKEQIVGKLVWKLWPLDDIERIN